MQKGKQTTEIKWPMALRMLDTVVIIDCIISAVMKWIRERLAAGWNRLRSFALKIYLKIYGMDRAARRQKRKEQNRESDLAAIKKWQSELDQPELNQ